MDQLGGLLCAAAAVLFVLSAAWVWYTHWRLRRIMGHMSRMLDEAMKGGFQEQVYDESMLSLVEAKLAEYLAAREAAAQKVEEEKEEVKQLIADISHQTKTPVANLLLYAQMLEERELKAEERSFVQELGRQAQKLNFLIASLVKASRLETGMLVMRPEWGPLSVMLEDVVMQAAPGAKDKRVEIAYAPNGLDIYAYFDRKWTAEAVYNILDNAVKYSPEGGKVGVAVMRMELFVRIEVRDCGPGVAESETAKIFQRFYRGMNAHGKEGLGIGLYLARQILSMEGGYIKVVSEEGRGSAFYVYLPASERSGGAQNG